jgi:hypothetical protein
VKAVTVLVQWRVNNRSSKKQTHVLLLLRACFEVSAFQQFPQWANMPQLLRSFRIMHLWCSVKHLLTFWSFMVSCWPPARLTPKLEAHPLSGILDWLFNMFAATLHIWKRLLLPHPEDVILCWQGVHLTWNKHTDFVYWWSSRFIFGNAQFEAQPGHRLPRVRFFSVPSGNTGEVSPLGHDRILPDTLQLIVRQSYHSTLYRLRYWQRRKTNHKNMDYLKNGCFHRISLW